MIMTTMTKKRFSSSSSYSSGRRPSSSIFLILTILLICFLFSLCTVVVGSSSVINDDLMGTECLTTPTPVFLRSVRSTIEEVKKATALVSKFTNAFVHDFRLSNSINDCLDLLDLSSEELSWTLSAALAHQKKIPYNHTAGWRPTWKTGERNKQGRGRLLSDDLRSWLSAALGNQDTCIEGFESTSSSFVEHLIAGGLKHVTSLVSDVLAMVRHDDHRQPDYYYYYHYQMDSSSGSSSGSSGSGTGAKKVVRRTGRRNFPSWMHTRDRKLLEQQAPTINNSTNTNTTSSSSSMVADVVVAADGSGNFTRIMDAVLSAPDNSTRRYVIYIKRGLYMENVEIKKKKWNLMMIGDGMDSTIISGNRSFIDGWTTFRSATLAVSGRGFIARDLMIENTAGPMKHQAVALRSDSDLSALYRCGINGYQDTLYAHSLRQFYRECRITGTVDFIFGNGAVVFQNCQILARKPLPDQKNSITAQGRKDPNQNTGFSIQFSNITADSDLASALASNSSTAPQTYLGRPWKQYSTTVIMQSYMGSVIRPEGWLEWQGSFALDTLYYGEYLNYGPGAGLGSRVNWTGFHAINDSTQAIKFTVSQFIDGTSWLPSTGVKFTAGLLV